MSPRRLCRPPQLALFFALFCGLWSLVLPGPAAAALSASVSNLAVETQALLTLNALQISGFLNAKVSYLEGVACEDRQCESAREDAESSFMAARAPIRQEIERNLKSLTRNLDSLASNSDPKAKRLEQAFRLAVFSQETGWKTLEHGGSRLADLAEYRREIRSAEQANAGNLMSLLNTLEDLGIDPKQLSRSSELGQAPNGLPGEETVDEPPVEKLSRDEFEKKKAAFEAHEAEKTRREKARIEAETERRKLLEKQEAERQKEEQKADKRIMSRLKPEYEKPLQDLKLFSREELEAISEWHQKQYLHRINALDLALARFATQDRRWFSPQLVATCAKLDEVLVDLVKKKIPPSPNLDVNKALNLMLQETRLMTTDCLERRMPEAEKRFETLKKRSYDLMVEMLPMGLNAWPNGYPRYEGQVVLDSNEERTGNGERRKN